MKLNYLFIFSIVYIVMLIPSSFESNLMKFLFKSNNISKFVK